MGAGTRLCDTTIGWLNGLLFVLGDRPTPGDIFNNSSNLFKGVSEKLGVAIPGDNWIGEAASKYIDQNLGQKLRTDAMQNIDYLTGGFISNQAKYIKNTRDVVSAMKKMVEGARWVCDKLEYIPFVGGALSLAVAIPACTLASIVTGGALLYLTIMTLMNVTNLQGLLGRLVEMLTTLPKLSDLLPWLPDIKFPPEIKWPPEFNLPDIKLPDFNLPDFNWPDFPSFPGLPDFKFPPDLKPFLPGLPSLPDLFPGLPKLPDLIGGLPGLGDLFGGFLGNLPVWNDLPSLPDFLGGFAGLPTLNFGDLLNLGNLPAVGSLTSTLGQLQQLTGGAGGAQLLSSMAGQTGQLTSMAGQGASGGGSQQATLVSDDKKDDEEGAGAGTSSAERAPIEVTGGSSGQTEGRVL
jgi:hypothetical protein